MTAQTIRRAGAGTRNWAKPWVGVALVVFSLIAVYSSFGLLQSELIALSNPDVPLPCDLNPLIGCSDSLLTPEAHIFFGLPNASVGIFAFGALLGISAVLLLGGPLPRLMWWVMVAAITFGVVYVGYFLYLSVAKFAALCPFCMGMWFATLGAAPLIWFSAMSSGALGDRARRNGTSLLKYWWAVAIGFYLIVVLVIVLALPDKVGMLFG